MSPSRLTMVGLLAAASLTVALRDATAQTSTAPPKSNGDAGLRQGNIAASGQTVPDPQKLPSAPRTSIDRPITSKDAGRTDFGICKGC